MKNIVTTHNIKEEVVFKSDIRYENGQLEASNRGGDMSNIKLMLNRVQGIKELKPNVNKKASANQLR